MRPLANRTSGGTVCMNGIARKGAREWKPAGASKITCLMGIFVFSPLGEKTRWMSTEAAPSECATICISLLRFSCPLWGGVADSFVATS